MNDDRPQPQMGSVRPSSIPPQAAVSALPRGGHASSAAARAASPEPTSAGHTDAEPTDRLLRDPAPTPAAPAAERYLGCTIDNRYKVEGIVGEGGMGVVYQCRHKIIDKRVALKILRADLAKDPEVTERFLMEAKAASAIQDEHIISISDFGQLPDGAAYFVMEFLDGTPLAQLAGGGKFLPIDQILPIARQLAEGLGAAHQRGIVHRDLKPDNVFLIQRGKQSNFVKILDFGIAKVSSTASGRLTQAGSVFGTPHYMSPEQAAGTPLDQRGDIYSLGVMLYELATGRVPFDAENFVGILSQHLYQDPVPPRQAAPGAYIPAEFEAIILRCLAKRPEERYQSMLQLRDDLWQLERRFVPASAADGIARELHDPAASVEGTALSTELTLASLRPRRWPLLTAIALPLGVVGAVLAFQLGSVGPPAASTAVPALSPEALPAASAPSPSPAPPAGPGRPSSGSPPPAPAPSVPEPVHVLLGVAPTTAHVYLDGRDLGASPVSIEVPPGAPVTVEVRHPDYVAQRLTLDGSQERMAIELETKSKKRGKARSKSKRGQQSAAQRAAASRASARKKPPLDEIGGQLFVEPWQKP